MPATCAPEDVFAVLEDGWSYPLWVVGAARMRDVDDDWPAPGSRLHHSVGVWPAVINDTTSVVEREPGRMLRLKARAWPAGEADVRIEVTPRPGGCTVTITENPASGPATLLPSAVSDFSLRHRNTEALKRLVWLAEGRAGGDDAASRGSR
jgi:Polyketide cyclase / dehydrase and lipid transport